MNNILLRTILFHLFVFRTNKKVRPTVNPDPLGHLSGYPLCFFGAPVFIVLKSSSGAMNELSTAKLIFLSSGVTRGLSQGKAKLSWIGGPLATVGGTTSQHAGKS